MKIIKNTEKSLIMEHIHFVKVNLIVIILPVRDHDHLTGKYRQTVCSMCNLKMQRPNFVQCFFHNLSGHDSHFIITQLAFDTKSINVIPNTEEKLISFTKYISNSFQIRFVDSF